MRRLLLGSIVLFLSVFGVIFAVLGQDAEKSSLIEYVENQISSPSYQIRLNGIKGTLSSDVSFESITIGDEEGIWLNIEKPRMVWTRTALLRGRLEINTLEAEKITWTRKPIAEDELPSPESSEFALPELPVAVNLEKLEVGEFILGEKVMDLAARLQLVLSLKLDDDGLDLKLDANRLDNPGGTLAAITGYQRENKFVNIDIKLNEPQNGIVATALGLEGSPPVSLAMRGSAPLENLDVNLAFDVASERILDGKLAASRGNDGLLVSANLSGPLSKIMEDRAKAFLGPQSNLDARLRFPDAGGMMVENASLKSGVVSFQGTAQTNPDGFLSELNANLELFSRLGGEIELPSDDANITLESAKINLLYDLTKSQRWASKGTVQSLAINKLQIDRVALDGTGLVSGINNPDARSVDFDLDVNATGIETDDRGIADALGKAIGLQINGDWNNNGTTNLPFISLSSETFSLFSKGVFKDGEYEGQTNLRSNDLSIFSLLADRDLGGKIDLVVNGSVEPLSGAFDFAFDGNGEDLQIGVENADRILRGKTRLDGSVARGNTGTSFEKLTVSNKAFDLTANGRLGSSSADFVLEARLNDIVTIHEASSGELQLNATVKGENLPLAVQASVGVKDGVLAKKRARNLLAKFEGTTDGKLTRGKVFSDGLLANEPVELDGTLEASQEQTSISDLQAKIGATDIKGNFVRKEDGLMKAILDVASKDISSMAALMLTDATGSINGKVQLSPSEDGTQSANIDAEVADLVYKGSRLKEAQVSAEIADLLGLPLINASINAKGAKVGDVTARTIDIVARSKENTTEFEVISNLERNNSRLNASGIYERNATGGDLTLQNLTVDSNAVDFRLTEPGRLKFANETYTIDSFKLAVGNGKVDVSGRGGETLDILVQSSALPLSVANMFAPNLGLEGSINSSVRVTGTNRSPVVGFDVNGQSINTRQIKALGVSSFNLNAKGNYRDNRVDLETLLLKNPQQLDFTAGGQIPLQGNGLAVNVNGTAPLGLLEPLLRERGSVATGSARITGTVVGSLQQPRMNSGRININGATFRDPQANIALENINLAAAISQGSTADITASASLRSGGSIRANGSLGLRNAFQSNIAILLESVRYTDNETFDTRASGNLRLSGPLLQQPQLSGEIVLERTEITVPEDIGSGGVLVDVQHVAPSVETNKTLERLRKVQPKPDSDSGRAGLILDVLVRAPNRIFVRGRGLDAELGGQVRIVGPISNVSPQGAFELRRGRLEVLGRRINLDEGRITLAGDIDPILDLSASVDADDVLAIIRLSGRASDLSVTFSSEPELPEDEVLARIIFGRSISDLSPAQIVRLATIANELTGGNSPNLVSGLRELTGLDDIEVVDDGEGSAAVRAGRYVSDNVYLGVEAKQSGTEATINLDITDDVTARGAVDSEGNSRLGIFFEKDY